MLWFGALSANTGTIRIMSQSVKTSKMVVGVTVEVSGWWLTEEVQLFQMVLFQLARQTRQEKAYRKGLCM